MNTQVFWRIFHILLGLTYIGLGIFMYLRRMIPISTGWQIVLSMAFIAYGIWRIYRSGQVK